MIHVVAVILGAAHGGLRREDQGADREPRHPYSYARVNSTDVVGSAIDADPRSAMVKTSLQGSPRGEQQRSMAATTGFPATCRDTGPEEVQSGSRRV
jgi:hypothetical protein